MNLPAHLDRWRRQIEGYAREYGLDFYDVVYEVVDYDQLNEVAAYGGFPTRYPHWRFGMEYEELAKSYSYGLSKIYELVINNNPVYAYLMKANSALEQKLVMAHVFGHADFFKNNLWFSETNRRMIDEMANHATRVRQHIDRHGVEAVEDFIDACLSLENLIDYHGDFIERRNKPAHGVEPLEEETEPVPRLPSKGYMDRYINPPAFLQEQKARQVERAQRKKRVPDEPRRDVLQFLLEHAPLEHWERDILSIVREEAYYFAPQGMTKVLNEGWACLQGDSLTFSDRGLVTIKDLVEGPDARVSDGEAARRAYDRHVMRSHPTVTIRTRRGLTLCGSNNHRILLPDGLRWARLDSLTPGDRVAVSGGNELWPECELALDWRPRQRITMDDVAEWGSVSRSKAPRLQQGRGLEYSRNAAAIALAIEIYDSPDNLATPIQTGKRKPIRLPDRVDDELGAFLGYLVGDGNVSRVKRNFGLTTGDEAQALEFARLARRLFGLLARIKWDAGRWRVLLHSETVSDFLMALGLAQGPSARDKNVPDVILRSPRHVVVAFLRACFDCDGCAGGMGVILSTSSQSMSEQVQLLLLNLGILSRRRPHKDCCWHVHVTGRSARAFAEKVGFGLARKQKALEAYLAQHRWYKEQRWDDEVVSIEHGRADVYDISVAETHRYAAGGFINHNSYWHATIMTQRAMGDSEVVDFADHHAGTLAMTPGRLNPYKIGIELFREIEDRWNKGKFGKDYDECDDLEARRRWDRKLGLGRQKIFEVRKIYNDVTFIDAFLNEEFCERLKLYVYGYDSRSGRHVVQSKDWRKVKEKLLFSMTNLGQPLVEVTDANYANRGELYLKHRFEGVPLDLEKAKDTLKNLHRLWRRPVHLQTVEDGRDRLLSFDGTEHKSSRL